MRERHESAVVSALNTRTMAELYLAQGHPERTKRIVCFLQQSQPEDASLQALYATACAMEAELAAEGVTSKPKRRVSDKPRPVPKVEASSPEPIAEATSEAAVAAPAPIPAPSAPAALAATPAVAASEGKAGAVVPLPPKATGARFEIVAEPDSWRDKGLQTLDHALAFMVERSARIVLRVARKRW